MRHFLQLLRNLGRQRNTIGWVSPWSHLGNTFPILQVICPCLECLHTFFHSPHLNIFLHHILLIRLVPFPTFLRTQFLFPSNSIPGEAMYITWHKQRIFCQEGWVSFILQGKRHFQHKLLINNGNGKISLTLERRIQ